MQPKTNNQPLTDEEFDVLDDFLLYRSFGDNQNLEDREYVEGFDEGIIDLNELDGFLTAIVSGPVAVMPSQWLPLIWGDEEPFFESEEDFSLVISLFMRHMNHIAQTLMQQPEDFYPLFVCRKYDDKEIYIVDDWCEGYRRAVRINEPLWIGCSNKLDNWLDAINSFTEESNWSGHEKTPVNNGEERAEVVWHAALNIHQFWLNQRTPSEAHQPKQEKVGRNQPCPCGSGKKFKKCCLH